MFVTAEIATPAPRGSVVPARAVFLSGKRTFVFIEESRGVYARTEVQTARETDGMVLVSSGVDAGRRVVVDGSLFLQQVYQSKGGT